MCLGRTSHIRWHSRLCNLGLLRVEQIPQGTPTGGLVFVPLQIHVANTQGLRLLHVEQFSIGLCGNFMKTAMLADP